MNNKTQCACCGYFTIESIADICPVCYWQKDFYQEENIDDDGGANSISLRCAKENFKRFGAIEKQFIEHIRPPFEDEKIKITKNDLKNILLALINKIEKLDNSSFSLDNDLYWSIQDEELYNIYEEPQEITIGSLKDDWDFLQKILNEEREVIGYDFNKVSNILKKIGSDLTKK